MPDRGSLARPLWWLGAMCAGVLAVIGGLGLRGPGLVAVGVAATLAACTAVGIARETPGHDGRSVLESAVQAAAWTVGILLALSGVAVLAGGLAAVLTALAGGIVWLLRRATRSRPRAAGRAPRTEGPSGSPGVEVLLLPVPPEDRPDAPSGLAGMDTAALGREWLRTSAALDRQLTPAARAALVRRREETLDELERRDPAGFARWLFDGPSPSSDPAAYVQARPVQDDPATGSDAA